MKPETLDANGDAISVGDTVWYENEAWEVRDIAARRVLLSTVSGVVQVWVAPGDVVLIDADEYDARTGS